MLRETDLNLPKDITLLIRRSDEGPDEINDKKFKASRRRATWEDQRKRTEPLPHNSNNEKASTTWKSMWSVRARAWARQMPDVRTWVHWLERNHFAQPCWKPLPKGKGRRQCVHFPEDKDVEEIDQASAKHRAQSGSSGTQRRKNVADQDWDTSAPQPMEIHHRTNRYRCNEQYHHDQHLANIWLQCARYRNEDRRSIAFLQRNASETLRH